ncbi:MAG: FAD-binding protein [Peptococcaceae bacterium]|jgi:succinate dehydrogenase/fumarate reductase flavoprotein subunit|nr:FAD-binding protein [Peptococcaceae bacterium]MDH7524455.1 FAD-binding protein [Peptococcaceae bacterium]
MLTLQNHWDLEADVVVIGYGAAGAVAAITAHDAGASVIILEKQEAGTPLVITSSFMSGGSVICPSDIQEARRYMESLYRVSGDLYWTEPDVIRVWAQYTAENKSWFESMGGQMKFIRHGGEHKLPGYESIDVYGVVGKGPGLMRVLDKQIHARGIPVKYGTAAHELLINSKGEVIGVKAAQHVHEKDEKKVINVQARRAVILTTGGFEFDEEMKLQYLRVYPAYFTGTTAATGDGIRMGLGVGAQLWHMNCCSARAVIKIPDIPQGMSVMLGGETRHTPGSEKAVSEGAKAGYVMVERNGKRFTNENFKSHSLFYELTYFDSQRVFYPRVPCYWVFDRKRMESGSLVTRTVGAAGAARFYRWSDDNSKELERGWIKQGESLKELALKLGIDPQTLETTVNKYNLCCEHGEDVEYRRPLHTLIPLKTPPFYAIELWPGGPNTQGGPRRNSKAQVLRADGTPVPRLYSAGELGSIYGMLYPTGGGNLAECIAFGRIAGENASECRPF